ncbi:Flagellar basal body rod protein FlgB [Aquimixticola soesokkakensis]|uniref:Flagellar basal body rod protein FlgB n=1 Tax=Aquimixticola soesokkakensis TaxID=1519096 RepID=A0A1Y5RDZ0_9RHOB|nr:FlgB family protein [Aquimixticola soesokkakensis]SLN12649.1 Flagellar basal body rod protein FlgB [Aquimixticola soesokkakensis]
MFEKLEMFKMAQGLAQHASARQGAVAENIANADTPGYRAKDLVPFADSYQRAADGGAMRATRAGHRLSAQDSGAPAQQIAFSQVDTPDRSSPNGNTVALETEMMKATEVRHQHDLALSIYKSSMTILRTSIGRR